jgi:hypothetical protein
VTCDKGQEMPSSCAFVLRRLAHNRYTSSTSAKQVTVSKMKTAIVSAAGANGVRSNKPWL